MERWKLMNKTCDKLLDVGLNVHSISRGSFNSVQKIDFADKSGNVAAQFVRSGERWTIYLQTESSIPGITEFTELTGLNMKTFLKSSFFDSSHCKIIATSDYGHVNIAQFSCPNGVNVEMVRDGSTSWSIFFEKEVIWNVKGGNKGINVDKNFTSKTVAKSFKYECESLSKRFGRSLTLTITEVEK